MSGPVTRDIRCATRSLLARPAYALVVLVTIALVVGPSAAVLAVVNASLVRAVPFADGDRLVRIFTFPPGVTGESNRNPLGSLDFVRFQGLERVESVAGIWALQKAIDGADEPESVATAAVSANLFRVLGASPALGRTFTDEEDRASAKVVVISHALWQRRFGLRPDIIGQTLSIDREPHEVIGVMGPEFNAAYVTSELWTPLAVHAGNLILPQATFIQSVARLKPGASVAQVQAESSALMAAVGKELPAARSGWTTGVATLRDAQFGSTRPALMMLIAAIVALALIACANLTNLNLAEIANRQGEIAVRSALGARRVDLVRAHVIESAMLALAGGAIGILLALWTLPALLALDPAAALLLGRVAVDWHVQAAAAILALIVSLTAGAVAVLSATSGDLARGLSAAKRRTVGSRTQRRVRFALVAAETTMTVVLLTAGALLVSAFDHSSRTNPGFDPGHVLTAQLRLPVAAYATPAVRAEFVKRMLAAVRATPGVADASTTQNLFVPGFTFVTLVRIDGKPAPDGQPYTVNFRRISPGYFRTMRIPVLHGRTFDDHDDATGAPVAIVSRQFAEKFWPGEDAVGRRVQRSSDPKAWLTVVGVVGDASDAGFGLAPAPTIYTSYAQSNVGTASIGLVARTVGDPLESSKAILRAIHTIDPAQPLSNVMAADRYLHESLGPDRFRSVVLLAFAALGLALASIGIYGVTSRGVAERTREMGVRLALGGRPLHIRRLVLRQSLAGVAAGFAVGVPAAVLAGYGLRHWLPGVESAAPAAGVVAQAALVAAGLVAAGIPAIRAGRVDPLIALRDA
jgi:predicted permease